MLTVRFNGFAKVIFNAPPEQPDVKARCANLVEGNTRYSNASLYQLGQDKSVGLFVSDDETGNHLTQVSTAIRKLYQQYVRKSPEFYAGPGLISRFTTAISRTLDKICHPFNPLKTRQESAKKQYEQQTDAEIARWIAEAEKAGQIMNVAEPCPAGWFSPNIPPRIVAQPSPPHG